MKSLLVAVSGTSSDNAVLGSAYAVAMPLKAHLDFVHIPLASIATADFNRHVEFARGSGLDAALRERLPRSEDAEAKAHSHVTDFCAARGIVWISRPACIGQVTANWLECPAPAIDGFMGAARAHDLTVIGRSAAKRGWSQVLLEKLTVNSGRPVLIVPPGSDELQPDRVAIWWKDHSAAARAVTAALPLLGVARQVTVFNIPENGAETGESAEDVARQLGWHGITATAEVLNRDHRPPIDILWSASHAGKADIIVMGGFSRPRVQEMIFGGCTQSVLEEGDRPVFLMH